ncbi:MAG: DUF6273 domain-containing protein, partial [Clostridia bacterium]
YRCHIPQVKVWWWTCTPWSTKSGADDNGNYVRSVNASGALVNSDACNRHYGVRPLCALRSNTLVFIEDGEDKSGGKPK